MQRGSRIFAILVVVASFLVRAASADEPVPARRVDRMPLRLADKLTIAGAVLFSVGHATSTNWALTAYTLSGTCLACEGGRQSTADADQLWGLLPVAGPLVLMGKIPFQQDKRAGFSTAALMAEAAPYAAPAVVQVAGLALWITGAILQRRSGTPVARLRPSVGAYPLVGGVGVALNLRW
jgi:hypothetical protein